MLRFLNGGRTSKRSGTFDVAGLRNDGIGPLQVADDLGIFNKRETTHRKAAREHAMTARTNSYACRARSRRFAGSICWIALFASLGAAPGKKDKAETPWAFRPVQRPQVPRVVGDVRNPIDAFLLESIRELELKPVPEADKRTLIRRLTFDLIGLPPSPEEVDAFVGDDRADAYERLVDRLLASPHYGERWGRHWLDLVRFAETRGYERDDPNPDAWRYRDYVIRSLNEDKPYDRFVLEQIAGDEIPARPSKRESPPDCIAWVFTTTSRPIK